MEILKSQFFIDGNILCVRKLNTWVVALIKERKHLSECPNLKISVAVFVVPITNVLEPIW